MQQISELNVDTTINELLNSELGFLLIKKDTKNEDGNCLERRKSKASWN